MFASKHVERWKNLAEENKTIKFVMLVLLLGMILEGIYINGILEKQKVIIVPPYISEKIEISGKKANIAYIRMMCEYALNLLLDWTHFTVNSRFKEFMAFVDPSVAAKISRKLEETAEEARKRNVTQAFYLTKLEVGSTPGSGKGEVTADGMLQRFVFDQLVKTEKCRYVVRYKIKNGKFMITSINKIEGEKEKR